jgi:hypothetical protein
VRFAVTVVAAAMIAVAVAAIRGGGAAPAAPHGSEAALFSATPPATPPGVAVIIPKASPLRGVGRVSRWAQVTRSVKARRRPGGAVIARVSTRTPEHTANIVLVTAAAMWHGQVWVRARLAVLPNGTSGWLPRSALGGYGFVRTHLVVSLRRMRATLWRGSRAVFEAPVGIGTTSAPTPRGQFYIRDRLTGYASAFYGPIAFGTSARSAVLTDWPDGGYIGIHGTDEPQLIPGRISHGCVRMRNRDIRHLAQLMQIGTPVTIE